MVYSSCTCAVLTKAHDSIFYVYFDLNNKSSLIPMIASRFCFVFAQNGHTQLTQSKLFAFRQISHLHRTRMCCMWNVRFTCASTAFDFETIRLDLLSHCPNPNRPRNACNENDCCVLLSLLTITQTKQKKIRIHNKMLSDTLWHPYFCVATRKSHFVSHSIAVRVYRIIDEFLCFFIWRCSVRFSEIIYGK